MPPPGLGRNGMAALPLWQQLEPAVPQVVATMRRYLDQIACVLRPGSVTGADLALRSFAGFLLETAPEVTSTAQVTRGHIEDYKPWLAARPGQNKARVATATLAHRLGTLRMFFVRIDEWGWDAAPPRVPMFPGDLPRQDHLLPKALDDAAAAKLLRAAQAQPRLLVRVTVEVLLRTGLRVGEFTALPADAGGRPKALGRRASTRSSESPCNQGGQEQQPQRRLSAVGAPIRCPPPKMEEREFDVLQALDCNELADQQHTERSGEPGGSKPGAKEPRNGPADRAAHQTGSKPDPVRLEHEHKRVGGSMYLAEVSVHRGCKADVEPDERNDRRCRTKHRSADCRACPPRRYQRNKQPGGAEIAERCAKAAIVAVSQAGQEPEHQRPGDRKEEAAADRHGLDYPQNARICLLCT